MQSFSSDLKIVGFLLLASLLILVFDLLGLMNLPKSIVSTLTIPIELGIYKTGESAATQMMFLWDARKAGQENKALQLQLQELINEKSQLTQKLTEAEALLEQKQTLGLNTFDTIAARPIGEGRYLMLNKGTADGVKIGDAVIFKDNYVGKIKAVDPKTSSVILLSDPDSKIAVFSQGQDGKAKGILEGEFNSAILMDKILHQEQIKVGDLVYSEGIENHLPRGLVMGSISKVDENPNGVFKQAEVEPNFEISDLAVVFIIKNI